jgi:hypothetical protein
MQEPEPPEPPANHRRGDSICETIRSSIKDEGKDAVIARLQLELECLRDEQET